MACRTSARLKNKRATNGTITLDSSINSAYQKLPSKRRKTAADITHIVKEKTAERKIRGVCGNLKLVTEMPLEILDEIFSHLQPADLLHLSQANKSLHSILLSRRAQSVWKASFANLQDSENPPPQIPSDITYPNYALLLFGTYCQYPSRTISTADPTVTGLWFQCPAWSLKLPKGKRRCLYIKEDCERVLHEKGRLKDNQTLLKDFTEAQMKFCRERIAEGSSRFGWAQRLKQKRKNDLQSIRLERQKQVSVKLRAEGWGPELDFLGPDGIANLPGADKAQALTERIWSNILPALIEFLEEIRVIRLERERKDLIQCRMEILYPEYEEYLKTRPYHLSHPAFADICGEEPLRALIFSTPADDIFQLPNYDQLKNDFAKASKAWVESRSRMLEALLPPNSPRLDLAATFFRCRWCKEPISYPRILKHICLIANKIKYKPSGEDVELYKFAWRGRPWNFGGDQVEFNEEAAGYARDIISVCGADPQEVSAEAMNELDCRVECLRCSQVVRKVRLAMRWTTAVRGRQHLMFRSYSFRDLPRSSMKLKTTTEKSGKALVGSC
ncbi:hypothetical protein C0993_007818 [Termitomyces sp. T159_Od127]|nr:hypothetical protein C0993_007818 [Termitomyces sp. T159_Od127]